MRSLWQIITNTILVLVFIALTIFSITEYQDNNLSENTNTDKLPLSEITFSSLSHLIAYFEQMPMIKLLPVATKSLEDQTQMMGGTYQEQFNPEIIKTNIKEKIPVTISDVKNNLSGNISLLDLWRRLKEQLSKDWSRP